MDSPTNSRPIGWMIASFLFAMLSLGVFPPLTGGVALFCAYNVYQRDRGLGQVCMVLAGIALIVGVVVGALWGAENIRF